MQNLGLCNTCKAQVPAEFHLRDNQVWIEKDCPQHGKTESLVSSDAAAWQKKRDVWRDVPTDPKACTLHCDQCKVDHKPNIVFVDVTNRCNMHCPICIATIRGMGFDFNPPLAYFEKLFAEIGRMNPQPVLQFFGGEPTVRNDLLELIALARKNGLNPHIVTNGVRLADEEYCKKLCETRVGLRFGFDGEQLEIYEKMRHNRPAGEKKLKALENLHKHSLRKHAIVAAAAWGINSQYMKDFLQYIHDRRDLISDVGIIPLTENWEPGTFDAGTHTTMEDVERMVKEAIPGGGVEFIPAGLCYSMKKPRSFFRDNPRSETLLLAGVHPNCESMTLLVSDGKTYHSIGEFLKKPTTQVAVEFSEMSRKLEAKLNRLDPHKRAQRLWGQILILTKFVPWGLRRVKLLSLAKILLRKRPRGVQGRRSRPILRLAMLPFEEQHSVDAARMEACKAAFAYEDVETGKTEFIPACLWYPFRNPLLKKISEKYGTTNQPVDEQPVKA